MVGHQNSKLVLEPWLCRRATSLLGKRCFALCLCTEVELFIFCCLIRANREKLQFKNHWQRYLVYMLYGVNSLWFAMLFLEVTRHEIPSTLSKRPSSAAVARRLSLEQMCRYCLMKLNGHCHQDYWSERLLCFPVRLILPLFTAIVWVDFKSQATKSGSQMFFSTLAMWCFDLQMSSSLIDSVLHSVVALEKCSTCHWIKSHPGLYHEWK